MHPVRDTMRASAAGDAPRGASDVPLLAVDNDPLSRRGSGRSSQRPDAAVRIEALAALRASGAHIDGPPSPGVTHGVRDLPAADETN